MEEGDEEDQTMVKKECRCEKLFGRKVAKRSFWELKATNKNIRLRQLKKQDKADIRRYEAMDGK